eukprot:TRINITY_DN1737_c0_g1_i1.p1 TRINITY_DN1737_c0_g1~~TRINITY_DN1737_c0_g1_i1.p1  ORF type:complete len:639 (+),score=161.91 TRINITY_DN1737_c0_g1_i1:49-1917(+)
MADAVAAPADVAGAPADTAQPPANPAPADTAQPLSADPAARAAGGVGAADGAGPAVLAGSVDPADTLPAAPAPSTRKLRISLPPEGELGIGLVRTESGLVAGTVDPDSPSHRAGVREGVRILQADGQPTAEEGDFISALTAARHRKSSFMEVTIRAAPAAAEAAPQRLSKQPSSKPPSARDKPLAPPATSPPPRAPDVWDNLQLNRKLSTISVKTDGLTRRQSSRLTARTRQDQGVELQPGMVAVPKRVVDEAVERKRRALEDAREARRSLPIAHTDKVAIPCRLLRTPLCAARVARNIMQDARCNGHGVLTRDGSTPQEASERAYKLLRHYQQSGELRLHLDTVDSEPLRSRATRPLRMHSEFPSEAPPPVGNMPPQARWGALREEMAELLHKYGHLPVPAVEEPADDRDDDEFSMSAVDRSPTFKEFLDALPRACTACGRELAPDSAYCHGCGAPVPRLGEAPRRESVIPCLSVPDVVPQKAPEDPPMVPEAALSSAPPVADAEPAAPAAPPQPGPPRDSAEPTPSADAEASSAAPAPAAPDSAPAPAAPAPAPDSDAAPDSTPASAPAPAAPAPAPDSDAAPDSTPASAPAPAAPAPAPAPAAPAPAPAPAPASGPGSI